MLETKFAPHTIYYLYNQGNNQQPIFFNDDNYLFFLWKMRKHLLPYVDFLAFCLMPNHFHWLVMTKPSACELSKARKPTHEWSDNVTAESHYQQNLSHNVAVLLRSYARAVNKQENRTGSLFRQKTKTTTNLLADSSGIAQTDQDFAMKWFYEIHQTPVEAGLVLQPENWRFSSAKDYAGNRRGTLCNKELTKQLLLQTAVAK